MATTKQLLIIYNADSTIRGKLNYAYRKLSPSSNNQDPACAACDITHGGLSLKEVPGWTKTKNDIEAEGLQVVQWHRDEIEPDVKTWIGEQKIRYPVVLTRDGSKGTQDIKVVMDSAQLAQCAGDARRMVEILQEEKVLKGPKAPQL